MHRRHLLNVMHHYVYALILMTVLLAGPSIASESGSSSASSVPQPSGIEELVVACRQEAYGGHDAEAAVVLGGAALAHKQRMAEICDEWLKAAPDLQQLLARCEREAAGGPKRIRSGRNYDRDHVRKLKSICQRLVTAAEQR